MKKPVPFEPKNNLTLFHQNIAGFLSKKESLSICLDNVFENKLCDVICLSETFVVQGEHLNLHLNNYNLGNYFCRDIRNKKKRGGVCIFVKKNN